MLHTSSRISSPLHRNLAPLRLPQRSFAVAVLLFLPLSTFAQSLHWQPTSGPEEASVHQLLIAETGNLYAGTISLGVFVSMDGGASWITRNNGLEYLTVRALTQDPEGRLYAGTGDGRVYYSDDGGLLWNETSSTGLQDIYAVSRTSGILFAGGTGGLCRSMDAGASWEQLNLGFPQSVIVATVLSLESGPILVGTLGMGAFRSTDDGDTWQQMLAGPPDNVLYQFTASRDENIFAATGLGVFRSIDEGLTWIELSDPPNAAVVAFAIDSTSSYLVASSSGVFRSIDEGSTWVDANSGLIDLAVPTLAVHPDGAIFAGTDGDGVYRGEMATGVQASNEEIPGMFLLHQNYPNPFNPITTFSFTIYQSSIVNLSVYDLLGRKIATVVNEKLAPGTYTRRWDARGLPSGVYFYRLDVGKYRESRKLLLLR